MADIIDALVVTLSLDPSKFKAGSDETNKLLKKTQNQASDSAKAIAKSGEVAAAFFTRMRNEAIGLFAVFTAGVGLKDFVRYTIETSAAVGRLAHNIGMTTESLSAWQGAAERAGGSASATGSSFQSLEQQFQQFAITGNSAVIPYFRALGVQVANAKGEMRPLADIMLDLADVFSKVSPQRASFLGASLGLDQGTINLLQKGRGEVSRLLEEQRRLGVVTQKDAEAGIAFQKALLDIQQALFSLGRTILTDLSPWLVGLLKSFDEWLQKNYPWLIEQIETAIQHLSGQVKALWDYLKTIDWTHVQANFEKFVTGVQGGIDAIGGLTNAVEIFFGLWVGAKALAFLSTLTRALQLLSFIPGSGVTAGVLGALGIPLLLKGDTGPIEPAGTPPGNEAPGWLKEGGSLEQGVRKWYRESMPSWLGGGGGPDIADSTMEPAQQKFLKSLSGPESGGSYDVKNGGSHFQGYGSFPEGVAPGGTSTAAGRYQFISGTWRDVAGKLGLTDFSPASQDKAAWYLARTTYSNKTGRDLLSDVREGGHDAEIARALKEVWPSLPGGSQYQGAPNGVPPTGPAFGPQNAPSTNYRDIGPKPVSSLDRSQGDQITIGSIDVHTQATDAGGIARDIGGALQRHLQVAQSNYGLA